MSMAIKYPRKHTVRLSEPRSDELAREASMPDVELEPSVLARTLIEEGLDRRRRERRKGKADGVHDPKN